MPNFKKDILRIACLFLGIVATLFAFLCLGLFLGFAINAKYPVSSLLIEALGAVIFYFSIPAALFLIADKIEKGKEFSFKKKFISIFSKIAIVYLLIVIYSWGYEFYSKFILNK